MSSTQIIEDLRLFTKELMLKEGVKDYDLQIKGYSEKGENYLGDVTFFSVVPKEEKKRYNLVMKTAKRSDELREMMPVGVAYKRESFMYQEMFPEMRKFLKSEGDVLEIDYVPKVYSLCDDYGRESLIMENLYDLGYRVEDRKKPMDLEHVLLVLEKLGKHHAISIAMRKKSPKVFEEKTAHLSNVWKAFAESSDVTTLYKPLIENVCKLLVKEGRKDLADKIEEKIAANLVSIMHSEVPEEDRLVISHGDCWNNNIMFKYQEADTKPTGVCFVDFQLSNIESPVKDLAYFLYNSCDKTLLDKFDYLIQKYYNSLSNTLISLGCEPEEFLTIDRLMEHWKKYANMSLVVSSMIVKIELLNTEEAPDVVDIAKSCIDPTKAFLVQMENEQEYNTRVLDVFLHFAEKFL